MEQDDDRGYACPPENLRDRLGGRVRTQVLLRMHRLTLTAVVLVGTFAGLLLATKLPSINLFEGWWHQTPRPPCSRPWLAH